MFMMVEYGWEDWCEFVQMVYEITCESSRMEID
jgi:hypothetical protein